LNLGDLSVLGQFIGEKMDFDKRIQDTCLAYGRDRGESNVSKKNSGYDELITDQSVDYVYVFDGDYWEQALKVNKNQDLIQFFNSYRKIALQKQKENDKQDKKLELE